MGIVSLGAAEDALAVPLDDEVEVGEESIRVYEEGFRGGDGEAVGFGHVREIRVEVGGGLSAEETGVGVEWWYRWRMQCVGLGVGV